MQMQMQMQFRSAVAESVKRKAAVLYYIMISSEC